MPSQKLEFEWTNSSLRNLNSWLYFVHNAGLFSVTLVGSSMLPTTKNKLLLVQKDLLYLEISAFFIIFSNK
jgi:hypothetical protein